MKKILLVLSLVLISVVNVFAVTSEEFVKAVDDNDVDLVKQYISTGININVANSEGKRGLDAASQNGNLEMVKLLVDKGANINSTSNYGGTDMTPLIFAVGGSRNNLAGCIEVIQYFISKKVDVNYKMKIVYNSISGITPLVMAAMLNQVDVVQVLIDAKANVNVSVSMNGQSFTIIDLAYLQGYIDVANALRNAGAKGTFY